MIAWGRYTFLLAAFVVELIAVLIAWRFVRGSIWLRGGIVLAVTIALIALWAVIRPTSTLDAETASNPDTMIANGKPTVLEFYSEY